MPPSAAVVERRRVEALSSNQGRMLRTPGLTRYPQSTPAAAEQLFNRTWESKFVPAVSTFVPFGTNLEVGTNPGQISKATGRRKELLRKRDGLPEETSSANIGKEGLENPLGRAGALTSFISGESFLHDSRHGELIQFPGYGHRSAQPAGGGYEASPQEASKMGAGGMGDGRRQETLRNPFLNIPGSADGDRKSSSPPQILTVEQCSGHATVVNSPTDEASSIPPWEAAQQKRWKQYEENREQIRVLADRSASRYGPIHHQDTRKVAPIARSKRTVSPGSLRSNLRDSTAGSPDSRKSITWEDQSPTQSSPTSFRTLDAEDARRARDAVVFNKVDAGLGAFQQRAEQHAGRQGGSLGVGGDHVVTQNLKLKSMDRVAALKQSEDVEGPSTPPGFPPVTKSLQEKGMQALQAQTLDLKEYTDTKIDRSGAPAILNYGARKKSAEGHEAPSERPLSRDMNRELRKKFVNPVPDAEMAHHSKAPSNVAYAIASRPFSEPIQRAGADGNDKTVCGFGITGAKAPLEETLQTYESVVKSNHAPWHHMKPPSLPLYKKPETKSRQRTDVWQVVPTVRGHMFVVSNKMTAAKPGEYEPSLDSAESQWAASQLALGPRAEKPYCTDEGDEASGFGVPEPTMEEKERAAVLRSFTVSRSSAGTLIGRGAGSKKLTMRNIRSAGIKGGADIVPRRSCAASFDARTFSLGVMEQTRLSTGKDPMMLDYGDCIASEFPAGAMLPGDLYLADKLVKQTSLTEHNRTHMPAAPVHPSRNDAAFESAKMQSESRNSSQYPNTIPCTLPDMGRIAKSFDQTNKMESNKPNTNDVLGCHALYDARLQSTDCRFAKWLKFELIGMKKADLTRGKFSHLSSLSSSTIAAENSENESLSAFKRAESEPQPHEQSRASSAMAVRRESPGNESHEELGHVFSVRSFEEGLPTDLEELRKLKYQMQDAGFGYSYRRDFVAPVQARGRFRHTYW